MTYLKNNIALLLMWFALYDKLLRGFDNLLWPFDVFDLASITDENLIKYKTW